MGKRNGASVPLSVSQNFLTSRTTIRRIINLARLNAEDQVIEIGAGKGHITRELARRCGRLTAVELDARLCDKLQSTFDGHENVRVLRRDFLRMPLPASPGYKIFANIPFSATTAMVEKITESRNPPADAWLVMEKGAAKRFCGRPLDGGRSLALKPFFDLRVLYYFRREDFHPSPSVDAVLLWLHRKENPDVPPALRAVFDHFIYACVLQSGGWRRVLSAKQASDALRRAGLPPMKAAGEMLYVQWLCLFRYYAFLQGFMPGKPCR